MVNSALGQFLFRYRGLTPIPFYALCLYSGNFSVFFFGVGLTFIISGESLRIWSVGYLGELSRSDEATASELVTVGPFRLIRNPIYLGNISIYVGFAVLSNTFFPLFPALTAGFFAWAYLNIISYEETFLHEKFGTSYADYQAKVGRFIPRMGTSTKAARSEFDWTNALRSERSTFLVMLACLAILIVRFALANV